METDIDTWFNSWERLWSVAQGAAFFFVLIVVLVRILGKRTTGQMNNFDWIITVAVGSLAASGILLKGVSILDATLAILVLGGLQWLTTLGVLNSRIFRKLVRADPRLLVHKGKFLKNAMRRERISEAEIYSVLRQHGYTSPDDANWVILETDGTMTVVPRQDLHLDDARLMADVEGWPEPVRRSSAG
jgi:uncharacterized membrane protein YcaP (DUF421 family)|tara:strand:- start:127791 stop:128354 length:564 start_codon:yes stop_codon:yes gene_type:complete